MDSKFEGAFENAEREQESTVRLRFIRHGEKEAGSVEGPDDLVRLSSRGRAQAEAQSSPETDLKQSLAFGSRRVRSRETAALAMAGGQEGITGEETFFELEEKLRKQQGISYGKKVAIDDRLNFVNDGKTVLGRELNKAYGEKRYFKFIVEDGDRRAEELGDLINTTFTSQAAAVAEVIRKYVTVSQAWHGLVNDPAKKFDGPLERFMGTHQSVPESFIAKVIELTRGVEERDAFVAALGNAGFGFAEEADIEIVRKHADEPPVIRLRYSKEGKDGAPPYRLDEEIPLGLLATLEEQNRQQLERRRARAAELKG